MKYNSKIKRIIQYLCLLVLYTISIFVHPILVHANDAWKGETPYFQYKKEFKEGSEHGAIFLACDSKSYSEGPEYMPNPQPYNTLTNSVFTSSDFKTNQKSVLLAYLRGYQTNELDPKVRDKDPYLTNKNNSKLDSLYKSIAKKTYCLGDKDQNRNVGGANFIMSKILGKEPDERISSLKNGNDKNGNDPSKISDTLFNEFADYINSSPLKISTEKYKYDRNSARGYVGDAPDWGIYIQDLSLDTIAFTINPEGKKGEQVFFALKQSCGNFVYDTERYPSNLLYSWSVTLSTPIVNPKILVADTTIPAKWSYKAVMSSGPSPVDIVVYSSDQSDQKKHNRLGVINDGAKSGTSNLWDETFNVSSKTCRRSDILNYSNGYYVIDSKRNKIILEGANDNDRHSSYTCIDEYIKRSWSISLTTTVSNSSPNIGDDVDFTHKAIVTSSTALPFDVDVYYQNSIKGSLSDKQKLMTIPKGSSKVNTTKKPITSTNQIKITENGDFCSQSIADLGSGEYVADSNPIKILSQNSVSSIRQCANTNRTPSVKVLGGDLTVGKSLISTLNSKIVVNKNSYVRYSIFSSGLNTLLGSGLTSSEDNTNCKYNNLTFSNDGDNNTCGGGYVVKSTMKNYSDLFPTDSIISSDKTEIDLKDYISGSRYKSLSFKGENLNIKSTRTITNSIVINAPNTTVTISENINRRKDGLTPSSIPQIIIIAKNIKIAATVTNIDAWLLSPSGYITTCDASSSGNPEDSTVSTVKCNLGLSVNGPIVSAKLYLLRTKTGDAAETISVPADSYIWEYNRSAQNAKYFHTTFTKELPPRI